MLIASETEVRIVNCLRGHEFARHRRSYDRGAVIEDPEHIAELAREKRRAHELRGRDRQHAACPSADAFIDALCRRGEPLYNQVARLLKLLDQYGAVEVQTALGESLTRGAISAASVAHLLDQRARRRRTPPPLDVVLPDDPRVRDLRVTPTRSPHTTRSALTRRRIKMTPLAEQLNSIGLRPTASHSTTWSRSPPSGVGDPPRCSSILRASNDAVEAALRLEFLERAGNVVLVAPQGLGKTMIAKNIAHQAVLAGYSVLFVSAAQMLLELSSQDYALGLRPSSASLQSPQRWHSGQRRSQVEITRAIDRRAVMKYSFIGDRQSRIQPATQADEA